MFRQTEWVLYAIIVILVLAAAAAFARYHLVLPF